MVINCIKVRVRSQTESFQACSKFQKKLIYLKSACCWEKVCLQRLGGGRRISLDSN